MVNFVLFETAESVIEVLWDIALAFFIVQFGFIYFLLAFMSGAALTYLTCHHAQLLPLTQHLVTTPQSEARVLAPALLLLSAACARAVVSRYDIPRVASFRLATGAAAALFMLLGDAAVGLGMWEGGYGRWVGERVGLLGFGGSLAVFALMPTALMAFEAKPAEKTWHGHEEKSIVDAVPTVNVSGKEKRQ